MILVTAPSGGGCGNFLTKLVISLANNITFQISPYGNCHSGTTYGESNYSMKIVRSVESSSSRTSDSFIINDLQDFGNNGVENIISDNTMSKLKSGQSILQALNENSSNS